MRALTIGCVAFAITMGAACGTAANGFKNVSGCELGNCTPCERDDECQVAVDCCGARNVCLHRDDVLAVCRLACAEMDNPPAAVCRRGECTCG